MATTHRAEFHRLILEIERNLVTQAHLKALLSDADETVADKRQSLRAVKARIKRARQH